MLVFGTVGIFVRYIALPSGFIAMVRGTLGVIFSVLAAFVMRRTLSLSKIKKNIPLLALLGSAIGVNWILLFESYRFTTVATATLCYYMAPVFVIVASPFVLGEKIGLKKSACVLCAIVGMVFVSGVVDVGIGSISELKGILLGLGAAALYAFVTLFNKMLNDISAKDRTSVQLFFATVVIIPYTFLAEDIALSSFTPTAIILLLVLGIVHTGLAYTLFFSSIEWLSAQTVAIFGYIDPIVAILLSAIFLKEPMTPLAIVGAVLIIISTLVAELPDKKE